MSHPGDVCGMPLSADGDCGENLPFTHRKISDCPHLPTKTLADMGQAQFR